MSLIKIPYSVQWTQKEVLETKKSVKAELDPFNQPADRKKRLSLIFKNISELEDKEDAKSQLRLYIFIMSALVHHERFGGLSNQQIRNLSDIAFAILQTQGIEPAKSRLAFLYGELHLVLSQVSRKEGDHWAATWEQQLSFQLAGRAKKQEEAVNTLATAIRAMRLGFSNIAYNRYSKVEEDREKDHPQFARARLGRILCLRLANQLEEADALSQDTLKNCQLTDSQKLELEWEAVCRQATSTLDFSNMFPLVKRGGSHYLPVYVVEAYFWTRTTASRKWLDRMPQIQTLARNRNLKPQKLEAFYDFAVILERCYDTDYPFVVRLRKLGDILRKTSQLISIDKELLVWAAAARWLSRNHSFDLASIALSQYQSISTRLSNGHCLDALGTVSDMFEKDWFLNRQLMGIAS